MVVGIHFALDHLHWYILYWHNFEVAHYTFDILWVNSVIWEPKLSFWFQNWTALK